MENIKKKNLASVGKGCVACGCCVKECPVKAVDIYRGIYAAVVENKCVGCGKCAKICPAGVVELIERAVKQSEEALV